MPAMPFLRISSPAPARRLTVSGVLAAFTKTMDDLKHVEAHHEAEATRQAQAIVEARAAHDASVAEAALARDIQTKFTEMLTPVVGTTVDQLKKEIQ
jgi:hypothetical protein